MTSQIDHALQGISRAKRNPDFENFGFFEAKLSKTSLLIGKYYKLITTNYMWGFCGRSAIQDSLIIDL